MMIAKLFRFVQILFAPPRLWFFLMGVCLGYVLSTVGLMKYYMGPIVSSLYVGVIFTAFCHEFLIAKQKRQMRRLLLGSALGFFTGALPFLVATPKMQAVDLTTPLIYAMLGTSFRDHRVSSVRTVLIGAFVGLCLAGVIAFVILRDNAFHWLTFVGNILWGAAIGAGFSAYLSKKPITDFSLSAPNL